MVELRRVRERHPELPRVVFVHQGDPAQGERLIEARWPGAPAVSDPERALYTAFGLKRGSLSQFMGLPALRAGLRAMLKGHFASLPVGDVRILPGLFLCHGREILWSRHCEHSGLLPDEGELLAASATLVR